MKKSDIVSIVIVAVVSVIVSSLAVNALLGNPDDAYVSYKTIEVVNADLAEPDAEVFNSSAINPTIEVYVGDCEDVDQDGLLSQAELMACGRVESADATDAVDENAEEVVEEMTEEVEEDMEIGEDTIEEVEEDTEVEDTEEE